MDKQLVYILANALTGGVSGYYTNDYAVKMIFRKYWGMGGVIVDTRAEFIANMSKLVERDVINVHTLAPALESEASKQVLESMLTDFWGQMRSAAEEKTIGQVSGMARSTEGLLGFYKTYAQGTLSEVLASLLQNTKLLEILSVEQRQHFAKQVYDIFLAELCKNNVIKDTIVEFAERYSNHSIKDFIPASFFKIVNNNLSTEIASIPQSLKAEDVAADLDELVDSIYESLACDSFLDEFEDSIKNKTLADILGYERINDITSQLLQRVLELVNSSSGQELINNLALELIAELKQVNVSLYSLLNDGLRKKLDHYLRQNLPWFVERLLSWIQANKPEVEAVIDQALEDVLNDDNDLLGIKNEAKKLLKDVFIGNIAVKYELVEKIVGYIQAGVEPAKAAHELSDYIIAQLQNKQVGELITSLEKIGVVRAIDVQQLLISALHKYLPRVEPKYFDALFAKKIGDFIQVKLRTHFTAYFKAEFKKKLQQEILCTPNHSGKIKTTLQTQLNMLTSQPLRYFVNADTANHMGQQLEGKLQHYLREHAPEFSKLLAEAIGVRLQDKPLDWAVNEDLQKRLQSYMAQQSLDKLKDLLEEAKTKKLVDIYNFLSDKLTAQQLSSFLSTMLTCNLDEFLQGKVEKAVADNLNEMSNEELQSMTENFIGKELGPITTLGGGMGLAIGGAAAAAGLGNLSSNMLVNTIGSGVLFGGIGWLTNVAAIQMIFKPYQPWRLAGVHIPLTPGIIPKQKQRFAVSMGEFIDDKLLVQERAVQALLNNSEQVRHSLFKLIYSKDYTHLVALLQNHQQQCSSYIFDFIQKNIRENSTSTQDLFKDEFSRLPLGALDYAWLHSLLSAGGAQLLDNSKDILCNHTRGIFCAQEDLGSILPDGLKNSLRSGVDGFVAERLNGLMEKLDDEQKFIDLIEQYSKNFDGFVQAPIHDLVDREQAVHIKHAICRFTVEKLQEQDIYQEFYNWLNERLEMELSPERKVGAVLDGLVINIMRESSERILAVALERALSALNDNRESIKQEFNEQFMSSSSILLKAANMILDIDTTIYRTIDRLIDAQLKEFSERKKTELQAIILEFVDKDLAQATIGELGITPSYRQVMELVGQMLQSKHTVKAVNSIVEKLTDQVFSLSIKELIQISNFRSMEDIYHQFWPEIRIMRYQLANNIHTSMGMIVASIGGLIDRLFLAGFYKLPMRKVLRGVQAELLLNAIERLFVELHQNGLFADNIAKYNKVLEQELRFKCLDELLDTNLLSRDLLECLQDSLNKEELRKLLMNSVNDFVSQLIAHINEIIKDSSKNYFLKMIIASFMQAMVLNFAKLLQAINIRDIAVQQIEAMSAENIKQMFDSFASKYFRRIERYGLIAGILGLLAAPLLAMLK